MFLLLERYYAALFCFGAKQLVEFGKQTRGLIAALVRRSPVRPKEKADHKGLLFLLERITGLDSRADYALGLPRL